MGKKRGKLRGWGKEGKREKLGANKRGRGGQTVKNPMKMRSSTQKERNEAVSLQMVASETDNKRILSAAL